MRFADRFVVIDPDHSHRAQLTYGLAKIGFKAEPFACLGELGDRWPDWAAFMVSNADDGVKSLLAETKRAGRIYPILAYSDTPRPEEVVEAVLGGVLEYLEWPFTMDTLSRRIEILQSRYEKYGSDRVREARAKERLAGLSLRERQVLMAMVDGNSSRAIAEQYNISPRTVESHRANMMRKVGANNAAEAVKLIYDAGNEGLDRSAA